MDRHICSLSTTLRTLFGLAVLSIFICYLPAYSDSTQPSSPSYGKSFHPPIKLLDAEGQSVLETHRPVSAEKTCGVCHDARYIAEHCYHADLGLRAWFRPGQSEAAIHAWDFTSGGIGQWSPLFYRRVSPPGDEKPDLGLADWLRLYGFRYVGGFVGQYGFGDSELTKQQLPRSGVVDDEKEPSSVDGSGSGPATPSKADLISSWDPDLLTTLGGSSQVQRWDWEQSGTLEMNCLLCHLNKPDNAMRINEMKAGHFRWATTATLAKTGVVTRANNVWDYRPEAFDTAGFVTTDDFRLVRPTAMHCGQCHGKVTSSHGELSCLEISLSDYSTLTKGQVFSGEKICDSGLNIENKQKLTRPWDVHASALLECRHCHFSLDNPALLDPPARGRPSHLKFEPRRLSFGEYLERPSHQFAKGDTPQGRIAPQFTTSMRTCRDCHNVEHTHRWLPFKAVHMIRLECETCHIPNVYAPALQSIDWSLPIGESPFLEWRGLESNIRGLPTIRGFRPAILPRKSVDGQVRLGPFNLILATYWIEQCGAPRPVRLADLQRVAAALGTGTGDPAPEPAVFSPAPGSPRRPAQVALTELKAKLLEAGVESPELAAEIWPFGLHHGVAPAELAIHKCETCHSRKSILGSPVSLGGGITALHPSSIKLVAGTGVIEAFSVKTERTKSDYHLHPAPEKAGFYILGKSRFVAIDALGGFTLAAVVVATVIHTVFRIQSRVLGRGIFDRKSVESA